MLQNAGLVAFMTSSQEKELLQPQSRQASAKNKCL